MSGSGSCGRIPPLSRASILEVQGAASGSGRYHGGSAPWLALLAFGLIALGGENHPAYCGNGTQEGPRVPPQNCDRPAESFGSGGLVAYNGHGGTQCDQGCILA